MHLFRRSIAVLAGAAFALTGCGGDDIPTKAEFTEELATSAKPSFISSMTGAGIDEAQAEELFDNLVGCVYDKVKDNEELLRQVADDSSDAEFNKVMEEKAQPCVEEMTTAVTDAMSEAAG